MTITSFEYEDRLRQWKLEKTSLGGFNLLVGVSGVGKTSIINALRRVKAVGLDAEKTPGVNSRWSIELVSEDRTYCWEAETTTSDSTSRQEKDVNSRSGEVTRFVSEKIVGENNRILVDRDRDKFEFEGSKLPKLKATESAISLLKEEGSITPLYRALQRIIFSNLDGDNGPIWVIYSEVEETDAESLKSIDTLRENTEFPILQKIYLAQTYFQETFERIREQYVEIFRNVTDVRVDRVLELDPRAMLGRSEMVRRRLGTLAIKERGVERWIIGHDISSGMLRTFFHLAELELAPRGTVLVIDEYENSMGINCLPAVTDHFRNRQPDLQFILTSHHPYVINNIPVEWWRVVTRKGGVVRVQSAQEIPSLATKSKQSAFTLLINAPEYEEGIQ